MNMVVLDILGGIFEHHRYLQTFEKDQFCPSESVRFDPLR
jgi:hypothetical protein